MFKMARKQTIFNLIQKFFILNSYIKPLKSSWFGKNTISDFEASENNLDYYFSNFIRSFSISNSGLNSNSLIINLIFLFSKFSSRYQTTELVRDYLTYPVDMSIKVINQKNSPFPAITICNQVLGSRAQCSKMLTLTLTGGLCK